MEHEFFRHLHPFASSRKDFCELELDAWKLNARAYLGLETLTGRAGFAGGSIADTDA
jgi:hypothetical protein